MSKKLDKIPASVLEKIAMKNLDVVPAQKYVELVEKYKDHDSTRNKYMKTLEADNKRLRDMVKKLKKTAAEDLRANADPLSVVKALRVEKQVLKDTVSELENQLESLKRNRDYFSSKYLELKQKLEKDGSV